MKLTAKVKLIPTPEQARLLLETLEQANRACNFISRRAWQSKIFSQYDLQKLTYLETRAKFNLTAQMAVHCASKVADAYKPDRSRQRKFRPHGGISYDNRILNWRMKDSTVSVWCLGGRQIIPFITGPRQLELLQQQSGETDLITVGGRWYLFAVCDIEEPTPADVTDYLGVDMGIVNIAADSDGNTYSGCQVNGLRYRHRRLREKLQRKGTHATHRLLKKLSGKEQRFATNINHTISKRIVATAQGTGRGIALEDLSEIRDRVTVRRSQRVALHSNWSFYKLRRFVEYKAQRAGVPIIVVDPRNTSRTCPVCGCIDKLNRKSQRSFSCIRCGFSGPADTIAATNIRGRATTKLAALPAPASKSAVTAGKRYHHAWR